MPPIAIVATLVGAAVIVEYMRRRLGGDDPLGPRPAGELPDTRWALVAGAFAWYFFGGLANTLLDGSETRRYGGSALDVVMGTVVNLLVALALLRAATGGARRPALAPRRLARVGVYAGFATFAVACAIGLAITEALSALHRGTPEQAVVAEARRAHGLDLVVFALGSVVVAPFAEEVFFRGILLPAASSFGGERTALALQAIVFGLVHVQGAWDTWPLAIPLAVVGWCAGFVYLRTGSLAVPILLHATFNALNFAALHST